MKNQVQKSTVSKPSMVKKIISLLPMAKKMLNSKIKGIMRKIVPNRFKKGRNTLKRVSNRGIKSLENNFSVKATKNIINAPKIVIEKSPIVAKPNVVASSKIAAKPKKVSKPKIVDKPQIFIEKNFNYDEYKNRVIKQLKKHIKKLFDDEKSKYLDDDDEEYKEIKDLEHLFEEINENDDDYYKKYQLKVLLMKTIKNMTVEGIRIKHYQQNNILIRLYSIKFVSLKDTEDIRTFMFGAKMRKLDQVMKQMILLKVLLILF